MPENRYVREIKLFNPNRELAVDDLHPNLQNKRPPVNPSEGLLDEPEEEYVGGPAPKSGMASLMNKPAPAAHKPAATVQPTPAASPAGTDAPLAGDIPEIIEGDFPEPIDL